MLRFQSPLDILISILALQVKEFLQLLKQFYDSKAISHFEHNLIQGESVFHVSVPEFSTTSRGFINKRDSWRLARKKKYVSGSVNDVKAVAIWRRAPLIGWHILTAAPPKLSVEQVRGLMQWEWKQIEGGILTDLLCSYSCQPWLQAQKLCPKG